jgi:hypothetical protein
VELRIRLGKLGTPLTSIVNYANFFGDGLENNDIFDLSSAGNRDRCYEPYFLLKRLLLSRGIVINTPDRNQNKEVLFELHMDAQSRARKGFRSYAILNESPQIRPANQDKNLLKGYRQIFTWRDDLVDGKHYIKLNLPNYIVVNPAAGWDGRERLSCMIANNKVVPNFSHLLLYPERVRAIRWFEKYAPDDFDLFGSGWDSPVARHGLIGRIAKKLQRLIPRRTGKVFFPSYRGRVASKLDTLKRYRFSICYENVRDLPGYITEKIFDCFFAGCIPVYWGAANIDQYIPEDCFIDRRKFTSYESLHQFMVSMKESEYVEYQERIAAFLRSDRAKPFSAEAFAETIVNTIMADLDAMDSSAQLG